MIPETKVDRNRQIESSGCSNDMAFGCGIDHVATVENEVDPIVHRQVLAERREDLRQLLRVGDTQEVPPVWRGASR